MSAAQTEYRIAVIGCGKRAQEHADGLKKDARAKVVALADPIQAASDSYNETNGFAATTYLDYHEMLVAEKPDVVIATVWPELHLPVYRDCAEAGVKMVLCEKPMAPTWGESLDMAQIAERTGCLLTLCHQRRFAPGNQMVRQLIREGWFGKVERIDIYSPNHLLDCGTHSIDQALSFNEESPAKWVLGAVDTSEIIGWFGIRAEKMATGHLAFENGVTGTIRVGGPDMDFWGGLRVTGSDGFVEVFWDGEIKRSVIYSVPDWVFPEVESPEGIQMERVIANALDSLQNGTEPELSHKKALRAAEVIFGLYESVRRRARVEIPFEGFTDNPLYSMIEGV